MQSSWSASDDADAITDLTLARRFVEASRRAEIIALVNEARTDREVAHAAVDELCEALEAEVGFLIATRPRRGLRECVARIGLSPAQVDRISDSRLFRTALGATRAVVEAGPGLMDVGARHAVLSPWTAEDGRQIVIGLGRLCDERFDPAELALVEAVSVSAGHAIERSWLGTERDRHAARQSALARAAKSLSSSLVTHEVLDKLAAEVSAAMEADVVVVYEIIPGGRTDVVATSGVRAEDVATLERGEAALCQLAARSREPRIRQPFEDDGGMGFSIARSAVAAPIRAGAAVTGIVLVGFRGDRWVEQADVELLAAFAELAGIATRNAADHAAVQRAATQDSLTGCLNHGAFQDRLREELARAERRHQGLALALVDLDDFKAVNDVLGHLTGDALLRGVAEALGRSVRPYDCVSRYGGDEFALLLPDCDEPTARQVVERAMTAVAGVRVPPSAVASASYGLAFARAGDDATALIDRADRSLLDAKRVKRGGIDAFPAEALSLPRGDRQRLLRLASAGGLGTRLARLPDRRLIAETAIAELCSVLGYEGAMLAQRSAADEPAILTAAGAYEDAEAVPDAIRRCLLDRRSVLTTTGRFARSGAARSDLAAPVFVGPDLWGAVAVGAGEANRFDDDDAQLVQRVADHLGAALRASELYDQLEQTHLGTAAALAAALEAKDLYTADHANSIAELAVEVGRELGADGACLRELRYGAIFHDIGKIAVPDAILNKPGPLTETERKVMERHPLVGEQILAPVPFLAGVRAIVRHDHERWDGGGYPDGLGGEDIPLGARIVLVADAYHAMRSHRPYRRAMPAEAARQELRAHAGTQFDPHVVAALLSVLARTPRLEP